MQFRPLLSLSLAFGLLSACAGATVPDLASFLPGGTPPVMRWDARPEAAVWTTRALTAVAARDGDLASRVPGDIATYCPGYASASLGNRRAFWVGLMSATAKHESSFNPKVSGGGGRYVGLMQIAPGTARLAGCEATSGAALKDGAANLECAIRIFAPMLPGMAWSRARATVAGRGIGGRSAGHPSGRKSPHGRRRSPIARRGRLRSRGKSGRSGGAKRRWMSLLTTSCFILLLQ